MDAPLLSPGCLLYRGFLFSCGYSGALILAAIYGVHFLFGPVSVIPEWKALQNLEDHIFVLCSVEIVSGTTCSILHIKLYYANNERIFLLTGLSEEMSTSDFSSTESRLISPHQHFAISLTRLPTRPRHQQVTQCPARLDLTIATPIKPSRWLQTLCIYYYY